MHAAIGTASVGESVRADGAAHDSHEKGGR